MKKHLFALALLASLSLSAMATPPSGGQPGNCGNGQGSGNACLPSGGAGGNGGAGGQGGAGGAGGQGGAGGIAAALSSAQASAQASAAAIAAQQQAQQQAQGQGQIQQATGGSAAGGAGGSAVATGGQGSGNQTHVAVDASTSYERSAPAIAVSGGTPLPTGCRYVLGLGGSNANGSIGTAGVPLWKDSECKAGAVFAAASRLPGVFTVADLKQVACENFDAMENTPTCKRLREDQRAADEAKRPAVAAGPSTALMP